MLLSAKEITRNQTVMADVCIIGAGPAGLSLANEFKDANVHVCLLESGTFSYDQKTQSLYEGEVHGEPYSLHTSRWRYFGGSTNHWGGKCLPLDESDFEERSWLPFSGWPFPKADLLPYYRRAQSFLGLGDYDLYDADYCMRSSRRVPVMARSGMVSTKVSQYSSPTRIGSLYRRRMTKARNITLIVNANVTKLQTNKSGTSVTHALVKTLCGNEFYVSAGHFVLAAGGIENARLLLVSDDMHPAGLGNANDLVGRYFMERYHTVPGHIMLGRQCPDFRFFTGISRLKSRRISGSLSLAEDVRWKECLTGMLLTFHESIKFNRSSGVQSFRALAGSIVNKRPISDVSAHIRSVGRDVGRVLPYIVWRLMTNSVLPARRRRHMYIQAMIEQEPNPMNRVVLSHDRDCLGERRARLNFRFSDEYWHRYARSLEIFNRSFEQEGLGRIQTAPSVERPYWLCERFGGHHMGTTRMHNDPRRGVVDSNGRVHGLANLYVTGSSVFPTSGIANPTLTLVALSIRLADYVRQSLSN